MFDLDPIMLIAQEGAAPPPGEVPVTPAGAPGGGAPGGGGGRAPGGFNSQFMLIMLGALLLLIIFSSMGPRREKKKREAMLAAIKKHDRVQTVGGVIGAIVELKPDLVVLKVDESANTRITFARSAIQQVLSPSDGQKLPAE